MQVPYHPNIHFHQKKKNNKKWFLPQKPAFKKEQRQDDYF